MGSRIEEQKLSLAQRKSIPSSEKEIWEGGRWIWMEARDMDKGTGY